jgi:EpsD family peptidyl-prolyl cis-trans isomerase
VSKRSGVVRSDGEEEEMAMRIYPVALLTVIFWVGCANTAPLNNGDTPGSNLHVKEASGLTEQTEEGEVLAIVNGDEITIDDYNDKLKRLSIYEKARYRGEEGHGKFLEALIQQKVMVQKARMMGLDRDEEVQRKIAALMQEVTERVLIEALIKQEILDKVVVTDREAKAYYDEHKNEYAEKEKAKIRQITVATEEDAQRIRQELENGSDFAELAKENSTDQHAANRGGDLGYVERGRMPAEFDNVVFSLEVGEISEAVKTNLGYHIIKLEDRKAAAVKEFYEVSDEIKKKLIAGKQREEHQKWLRQLEAEAKIEMKPGFWEANTESP